MQSTKVLALLISIVSFQSLQATHLTSPENSLSVKSDSVSKDTKSWWGQIKGTFSSWIPSFIISSSQPRDSEKHTESTQWWAISKKDDQPWAQEWSQLVGHVAEENARQTKILLTQMLHRKGEYLVGHQQGMTYYEEVAKEAKKSPTFIKEQDKKLNKTLEKGVGFLLAQLAEQADIYVEAQNTDTRRASLVNYTQDLTRFYQSIEQQELGLDQDYFDGDLFQQGYAYAKGLFEISQLDRRPENLPRLKSLIKELYTKLDGGKLSELSQDTLNSLNIDTDLPQARSSWLSSRTTGAALLFLVASSGLITTAAAARPNLLDTFCSTSEFSYGYCESGFAAPIGFETQIASIKSDSRFQEIITDKILQPSSIISIQDTLARIGFMQSQFYGELITSNIGSFSGGNATMTTYFKTAPYLGMQDSPISSTQYRRIAFNATGYLDSSRQTINSYTRTGPMEPSYYGQIENSERMILALTPVNETSFVYGVVVDRPFGGTPTVVREGVMTSNVQPVFPGDLIAIPPINNINSNGLLPVESIDSLISSRFYSGNVAGTDGLNPRPILQYLEDIGFSTTSDFLDVKNCLERPGVSPLACTYYFSKYPGFTASLYVYSTQPNSVVTLSRNLLQGTNYTEGTYQAGSGNVLETLMSYTWNPSLGTATRTNSTISIPFSTLRGSLPLNQIEKIWIYNPDPANSELGYVVRTTQNSSGTATSYYVVPGEGITTFTPTPTPTPSSPTPTPTDQPSSGPSSSGLSDTAKIGIGVGAGVGGAVLLTAIGVGVGCGVLKHKSNKSKLNDLEAGNDHDQSPNLIPLRSVKSTVTRENFNPSAKGIFSGITVAGKLFNNQYNLYFKVTQEKFAEIVAATGLKMEFQPAAESKSDKSEMDLILGGGNFGQVRIAQDAHTGEFVAVKIVPGNKKVQESLREGDLQHRLAGQAYVLPLLDRLHYTPATDKAASTKLLKKAFGNADRQDEDLLLQFTPLASFGDGEALSYRLSLLKDSDLKEKIVTYVAYSFVTGLMNMHNSGVSHLDFKLANLLLSWKGDVWVSDMGCALQKKLLSGGIGDFRYFPPERLKHVGYLWKKHKNPESIKKDDPRAFYSGHAADNFAAGITILELISNEHPFQDIFDQRKQGVSIPNAMLDTWTDETYEQGLSQIFEGLRGNSREFFKVIHGMTLLNPQERWETRRAQKALEALLPKESPEDLFLQFEQALLSGFKGTEDHPKDMHAYYQYVSPGARKSDEKGEKDYFYYKEFFTEETSSAYGQDLPVYEKMQEVYEEETKRNGTASSSADVYVDILEKPEEVEPTTYTVIPDEEGELNYTIPYGFEGSPPPRPAKQKSNTPDVWVYHQ